MLQRSKLYFSRLWNSSTLILRVYGKPLPHTALRKTHAGVTQYLEKSDSEKAFSSLRTWASLLMENNHIALTLWKIWKWQFTRLLVNKYQEKKWILVSTGSYRYTATPVWNQTKTFNLVLRLYFIGKHTPLFFGEKKTLS